MPFAQFKLEIATAQSRGIFNQYVYETSDTIAETQVVGYFAQSRFVSQDPDNWFGSLVSCKCSDGLWNGEIQSDGTALQNTTDIPAPSNVVYVTDESNFGTVTAGVKIDVIGDTTFVLQKPVTQTLPFIHPTGKAFQLLTTNRTINTLTYTGGAIGAQFQGTNVNFSALDVVFNGNENATAFDITGGILSLKFPDFKRYSSMGTLTGLTDLFSPGVLYEVIDNGFTLVDCLSHTFQGCLVLALDGNTLTFFDISGAGAGNVQIVDNLYNNDAFGSFVHIDSTFPTTKAALMARNLIDTPANFLDGTSITEKDLRMEVDGNKGVKNSVKLGEWDIAGSSALTTIASPDTFQDINVTGSSAGALIERFTYSNTVTGELTYIGSEAFDPTIIVGIGGLKSGATAKYTFTIAVNGIIPAGAPIASFEIKTALSAKMILGTVSLVTGDKVKIQVKGVSTSDNLTIEEVSFVTR